MPEPDRLPPTSTVTETQEALRIVRRVAGQLKPLSKEWRMWILKNIEKELEKS